jgi:MoxR-like ATPase
MIEIEKLQNITTFQGNAPFEEASTTPTNGEDGSGDPVSPTEKEKPNYDDFIDVKSKTSVKDLKAGDTIFATINSSIKDKEGKPIRVNPTGFFLVVAVDKNVTKGEYKFTLRSESGTEYKTSKLGIQLRNYSDLQSKLEESEIKFMEEAEKQEEERKKKEEEKRKAEEEFKAKAIAFAELEPEEKLLKTIESGVTNIWMVGPAGCGKSTIARNVAKQLNLPYLCISCGIGTSATEFVGYKYPERESTKFSEYYNKPSVILIDEFTALDPAVAQVCNAALANGEIETTTGLVHRHPECIIIATSNTFGNGADRQYVANNQLDASTIDRFVGGIIDVNYSDKFESQYDEEVVSYVNTLRRIIKDEQLRRIASTRMIQAGHTMKNNYFADWKDRLIINWSDNEKRIVYDHLNNSLSINNQYQVKYAA